MLGNTVSVDFIEKNNCTGLTPERHASAKRRPVLYIAVLLSAIFHVSFLYAFASEFFAYKKADAIASNQPVEIQLEIIQVETVEVTDTQIDPVIEPQILEKFVDEPIEAAEESLSSVEEVIVEQPISEPSIDLSEDTIRSIIAAVVEEGMSDITEHVDQVGGAYADGFDPRFRQKLIDSQNREPPPAEPELETWITGSGQMVAQISESHCIKSMETIDAPARNVGAIGGGGAAWSLPYKCGKDAGDRMMDRVNASISEYLR